MRTKLATAFGLAMLFIAFSFGTSFACPESPQTTASAVESTVSESGMNVTALAEASAPEGQIVEVGALDSVARNIETPSTEPSAPSAITFANAIPVEITETVTVVVPGQKSEDEVGPAMPASGIAGIEPSVTEVSSQMATPESETKATQIVDEPAAMSTDVNAPAAIMSVDAVPVEITVTVTVVVPGQTSEAIDEVEITGPQPEHPISGPNLKRDEATAALDDGE